MGVSSGPDTAPGTDHMRERGRKDSPFERKGPHLSRPHNPPDDALPHDSCSKDGQLSHNPQHTQDSVIPHYTPTRHLQTSWLLDTTDGRLLPEDFTNHTSLPPISLSHPRKGTPHFSETTVHTILEGTYPYTEDLLTLSNTSKTAEQQADIPKGSSRVNTPLVWTEWDKALTAHPDRHFRDYLLTGIRQGLESVAVHTSR